MDLSLFLLIVALVIFLLATFNVGGRFNMIAAGLAAFVAAVLTGTGF